MDSARRCNIQEQAKPTADIMRESLQKKSIFTERAAQSANDFSPNRRGPGSFTFLAYLTVIVCFFVFGALLWRFQIETGRDLDIIKSNLYLMATSTSNIQKEITTLEQFVIKNSASNTLMKNRLDELSDRITTLRSNSRSFPIAPVAGNLMRNRLPTSEKLPIYYEVAPGDTLLKIAKKYGVSARRIAVINNLANRDQIYIGQRILITKGNGDDQIK